MNSPSPERTAHRARWLAVMGTPGGPLATTPLMLVEGRWARRGESGGEPGAGVSR